MSRSSRISISTALYLCMGPILAQQVSEQNLATRDAYRACLRTSDELEVSKSLFAVKADLHAAEIVSLQRSIQEHVASQRTVNYRDKAAVDAFNNKLMSLHGRANVMNRRASSLNDELNEFNKKVLSANQRCAGMLLSADDKDAVDQEREEDRGKK